MKNKNKLALVLGLGALLPLVASAKSVEESYIDTVQRSPGIPVPVTVVAPDVEGFDVGKTAKVEFVVDATGHTLGFTVVSTDDPQLADAVIDAVKQWRFDPAHVNGAPVSMKVILPVRIVEAKPVTRFSTN
jgi:TonB family protein